MDDVYRTDILSRYQVPRHRLTVRDYYRLAEVGILRSDDRVELLEGQLVDMSPIGPRHALVSGALTELLVAAVAGRAHVRVQLPIALDDYSEPNLTSLSCGDRGRVIPMRIRRRATSCC